MDDRMTLNMFNPHSAGRNRGRMYGCSCMFYTMRSSRQSSRRRSPRVNTV